MDGDNNTKFKRNYRACLNCRVRKVKCDLGPVDNPREGKCLRCLRERKDCLFVESRRGSNGSAVELGTTRQHVRTERVPYSTALSNHSSVEASDATAEPSSKNSSSDGQGHFSTMEGALVFLAKAAGTIAKADERDNIDAQQKHAQIEASLKPKEWSGDNTASISSLLNSDLVPLGAAAEQAESDDSVTDSVHHPPEIAPSYPSPYSLHLAKPATRLIPLPERPEMVRPKASNKLSNFDYIGKPNGLLREDEAERLIHLFFTTMHPYFPFIPKYLHLPKVLAGYPILLCSILTISSRYHPFEDDSPVHGGVPRHIEVHDRLWLYVQRLISQTVWAEASTRSIGTIFAFLLFTEWNPRAIHWKWSDYANTAEDNDNASLVQDSRLDLEPRNDLENLAGLGATRRSYRMAWMLIGSAVRLAQDMGFMEVSPKTFLATHIAEINSVMNISRRSMLAHSLSELDLDNCDDEEDELLAESAREDTAEPSLFLSDDESANTSRQKPTKSGKRRHRNRHTDADNDHLIINMNEEELRQLLFSPKVMRFTFIQKAKIELLQIMSLGHESLYGYKAQLGSLTQRQNLSVLNILSPILKNWSSKYKNLLKVSKTKPVNLVNIKQHLLDPDSKIATDLNEIIDRESLIFEFNYTKLYIYSLALSPSPRKNTADGNTPGDSTGSKRKSHVNLKLDEISKAAVFIEQAFVAANEMLSVAQRIHKLKVLLYMPVRWVTRIVRAIAFVVKCYLTITAHNKSNNSDTKASISNPFDGFDSTVLSLSLISIDEIMLTIQRAAITLRDCSPDELHLCTRYSNVLMYLCSEMKGKSKPNPGYDDNQQPASKKTKISDNYFNAEVQSKHNTHVHEQQRSIQEPNLLDSANFHFNCNQPTQSHRPVASFVLPSVLSSQLISLPQNFAHLEQESVAQGHYSSAFINRDHSSENVTPIQSGSHSHNVVGDSEVMEWFFNNRDVGLDFVGPWTEMIEQQLDSTKFNFDDALL